MKYPVVLLAVFCSPVFADSTCYDESNFPTVFEITPTETGFRFKTHPPGPPALNEDMQATWWEVAQSDVDTRYFAAGSPELCHPFGCEQEAHDCPEGLPRVEVSREAAGMLRDDRIGKIDVAPVRCVRANDGYWYFGLAFYQGEGMDGLGGVGRWHPETKELEIRHLASLAESSINALLHDGRRLWLGTYADYECSGQTPTKRLLVYDWAQDVLAQPLRSTTRLTCGFVVHDFLQTAPNTVWVASDLGLTRVELSERLYGNGDAVETTYRSTHWWMDAVRDNVQMRTGECFDLYRELLGRVSQDSNGVDGTAYDQLVETLIQFEPYFVRRYLVPDQQATD